MEQDPWEKLIILKKQVDTNGGVLQFFITEKASQHTYTETERCIFNTGFSSENQKEISYLNALPHDLRSLLKLFNGFRLFEYEAYFSKTGSIHFFSSQEVQESNERINNDFIDRHFNLVGENKYVYIKDLFIFADAIDADYFAIHKESPNIFWINLTDSTASKVADNLYDFVDTLCEHYLLPYHRTGFHKVLL